MNSNNYLFRSVAFLVVILSWRQASAQCNTTVTPSGITNLQARSGGNICNGIGTTVTNKGICWSALSSSPGVTASGTSLSQGTFLTQNGSGAGSFTAQVTGLTPNTKYYIRAYGVLSNGSIVYGNTHTFQTTNVPVITTTAVNTVKNTATSGGNISSTATGITQRGVCWSSNPMPTTGLPTKTSSGSGSGSYNAQMINLLPNTTYYVRAFAVNAMGTYYGNQLTFTTSNFLEDIDKNAYDVVVIGAQTWMKENLKVTKFRNGSPIATGLNDQAWLNTTAAAYSIYDNNSANQTVFGNLYNWYTVNSAAGLCPVGWHVPTHAEWQTLINGLSPDAGSKLKSTGTMQQGNGLWMNLNPGATNSSGFSGFPGGFRAEVGNYLVLNEEGYWWSATSINTQYAYNVILKGISNGAVIGTNYPKANGHSVRCVKD